MCIIYPPQPQPSTKPCCSAGTVSPYPRIYHCAGVNPLQLSLLPLRSYQSLLSSEDTSRQSVLSLILWHLILGRIWWLYYTLCFPSSLSSYHSIVWKQEKNYRKCAKPFILPWQPFHLTCFYIKPIRGEPRVERWAFGVLVSFQLIMYNVDYYRYFLKKLIWGLYCSTWATSLEALELLFSHITLLLVTVQVTNWTEICLEFDYYHPPPPHPTQVEIQLKIDIIWPVGSWGIVCLVTFFGGRG